ncbi:putative E5 [Canis familiaris papillomavirus 19]|uniref:Putative E5 n=1 Tax=Canis familiaris papillomavirus 19 TaxID=2759773 RepID=A0A1C9J6S5_9PAPI|nr:putative E5 [Canis familiaris papillomavirus 19]
MGGRGVAVKIVLVLLYLLDCLCLMHLFLYWVFYTFVRVLFLEKK